MQELQIRYSASSGSVPLTIFLSLPSNDILDFTNAFLATHYFTLTNSSGASLPRQCNLESKPEKAGTRTSSEHVIMSGTKTAKPSMKLQIIQVGLPIKHSSIATLGRIRCLGTLDS